METIQGCVDRIIYRNIENGYTVLNLVTEEDEVSCVGCFTFISEGEYIEVQGEYTEHTLYGEQFNVKSYAVVEPKDAVAMERYLASGAIKGIKEATAKKIVAKFKDDTFRIMEQEPERLAEIKGISEKKAREIGEQFEEKREMRNAMLFLQKYGISNTFAVKIYNYYGYRMYDILMENPYKLAEDIHGIGFKLADEIAIKVGINYDSEYRIRAGIIYALLLESNSGNIYVYENYLIDVVMRMLNVSQEQIIIHMQNLIVDRKIVLNEITNSDGTISRIVYSCALYYTELNCARMLCDLNIKFNVDKKDLSNRIEKITNNLEIELDNQQKIAVVEAVNNAITIITGGPGTGKSATRSVVK